MSLITWVELKGGPDGLVQSNRLLVECEDGFPPFCLRFDFMSSRGWLVRLKVVGSTPVADFADPSTIRLRTVLTLHSRASPRLVWLMAMWASRAMGSAYDCETMCAELVRALAGPSVASFRPSSAVNVALPMAVEPSHWSSMSYKLVEHAEQGFLFFFGAFFRNGAASTNDFPLEVYIKSTGAGGGYFESCRVGLGSGYWLDQLPKQPRVTLFDIFKGLFVKRGWMVMPRPSTTTPPSPASKL